MDLQLLLYFEEFLELYKLLNTVLHYDTIFLDFRERVNTDEW